MVRELSDKQGLALEIPHGFGKDQGKRDFVLYRIVLIPANNTILYLCLP